eukprot:2346851-Amphidinium_carterae.1
MSTLVVLLWWFLCGVRMSWGKVQWGKTVQWIGVSVTALENGVRFEVTEKYAQKLAEEIGEVIRGNWISLAVLRQIAGRASWVAGVAFHVRGMLQPLWAAISDPHFGGDPNARVAVHRVRHALLWLLAFINGGVG